MQIFIETITGKNLILDVEPFDKIKKVKLKIEEKEGIPHQIQDLFNKFMSFRPLKDEKTLNEYGIHICSTLGLRLSMNPFLYIIYNEIGDKLDIKVKDFCPCCHDVNQLKNKITEILGIKPQFQELSLDGEILKDNSAKISEYGVSIRIRNKINYKNDSSLKNIIFSYYIFKKSPFSILFYKN